MDVVPILVLPKYLFGLSKIFVVLEVKRHEHLSGRDCSLFEGAEALFRSAPGHIISNNHNHHASI
jgi:hypothetical protein